MDNIKDMTKLKKMADEAKKTLEELRATGVSKKNYVKITLDGEKDLKNIEFSPEALKLTPDELARNTKEAHKMAAKEIDKLLKKQMKNSDLASFFMNK